ncbi:MAG: hypothetical protein JSS53_01315 [Proteobacteria bacterium]|nr:hypothetical protein [Pseudomonadota bacterium]
MSEEKKSSKLPDLQELTGMASKLFKDVKSSLCQIYDDYKNKRDAGSSCQSSTENKSEDKK